LAPEGEEEKIDLKLTFNPALQYFAQVIMDKVAKGTIEPDKYELPEMNPTIIEYLKPDRHMFESEDIAAFDAAFQLVEVEESKKNDNKKRVYWKDII